MTRDVTVYLIHHTKTKVRGLWGVPPLESLKNGKSLWESPQDVCEGAYLLKAQQVAQEHGYIWGQDHRLTEPYPPEQNGMVLVSGMQVTVGSGEMVVMDPAVHYVDPLNHRVLGFRHHSFVGGYYGYSQNERDEQFRNGWYMETEKEAKSRLFDDVKSQAIRRYLT